MSSRGHVPPLPHPRPSSAGIVLVVTSGRVRPLTPTNTCGLAVVLGGPQVARVFPSCEVEVPGGPKL